MAALQQLNFDILCEIAYRADCRTRAPLLLTCKTLNKAAAKFVLQPSDGIDLWKERKVAQFLRFLHADPSRFQHIRKVHILFQAMAFDGLLDGLRRMEQLETLGLRHVDSSHENFHALADAVSKLTMIRRLEICSIEGDAACILLSQIQADLSSIRLSFIRLPRDSFYRRSPRAPWVKYHPIPLLAKCIATLEELTCETWFISPVRQPEFTQVYPKLRRLSIQCNNHLIRIAPFIHAYPNLAQLTVLRDSNVASYHVNDRSNFMQRLYQHRAVNIRSQDGGETATWQHLEELTGTIVNLYSLGLTCHVRRVHINELVFTLYLELLSDLLEYAQPQHLKVRGSGALLFDPLHGLAMLLRSSCGMRLESLVVEFDLPNENTDSAIASALSDVADSLKLLPLRRLRLRVTVSAGFNSIPKILENFDLEAYLRDLADAVPSLEDAVMHVKSERDRDTDGHRCWTTRTAEAVRVRRLGEEYADTEMYEW